MSERPEKKLTRKQKRLRRLWLNVRPMVVMLISLVVVFFLARVTVNYVLSKYVEPVDRNDATPIEVTIPASSSASSIARILYGACGYDKDGLISSTAAFKVYVDFVGKANSLKAGTYVLSKNMSIKQIVEELCEGNPAKATVKFTIPEGYTIQNIARKRLDSERRPALCCGADGRVLRKLRICRGSGRNAERNLALVCAGRVSLPGYI